MAWKQRLYLDWTCLTSIWWSWDMVPMWRTTKRADTWCSHTNSCIVSELKTREEMTHALYDKAGHSYPVKHRQTDKQTGDDSAICYIQTHSCPFTPSYVLSYPGQMPSVASLFTLQKILTLAPIPPQIVPSYSYLSPPRRPQYTIVVVWIIYDRVFVEQGRLVVSKKCVCMF